MHRSRLHVVLIDTPAEVSEVEVTFWGAALGHTPVPETGTPFSVIAPLGRGMELAHQRLGTGPSRIHLDIETDDTEAEASRLEALGAVRVGASDGCVHLKDPAGLVFCVVPVQSEDFLDHASVWD